MTALSDAAVMELSERINSTTCPAPACGARKALGQLTCRGHWHRIPKHLRHAVLLAVARWGANEITLGELRDVQHAAIEAAKP